MGRRRRHVCSSDPGSIPIIRAIAEI
jgi:hypothetical protein